MRAFASAACLPVLLLAAACYEEEANTPPEHSVPIVDTTPPVLSVPFVDTSLTTKFIAFGAELGPGRYNPAYEIEVSNEDADVLASSDGVVERVAYNGGGLGQNDYEIFVRPSKNSAYLIIYDHVTKVQVSEGDSVSAGDKLGTVGDGGRTELQINDETDGDRTISPCPREYGTEEFNAAFEEALRIHNDNEYATQYDDVCLKDEVEP